MTPPLLNNVKKTALFLHKGFPKKETHVISAKTKLVSALAHYQLFFLRS